MHNHNSTYNISIAIYTCYSHSSILTFQLNPIIVFTAYSMCFGTILMKMVRVWFIFNHPAVYKKYVSLILTLCTATWIHNLPCNFLIFCHFTDSFRLASFWCSDVFCWHWPHYHTDIHCHSRVQRSLSSQHFTKCREPTQICWSKLFHIPNFLYMYKRCICQIYNRCISENICWLDMVYMLLMRCICNI